MIGDAPRQAVSSHIRFLILRVVSFPKQVLWHMPYPWDRSDDIIGS